MLTDLGLRLIDAHLFSRLKNRIHCVRYAISLPKIRLTAHIFSAWTVDFRYFWNCCDIRLALFTNLNCLKVILHMLRVLRVLRLFHHVYICSILLSILQIHSHLLLVSKLHLGLCYPSLETIKDAILTRGSHICCCIKLLLILLSPLIVFCILGSMLLALGHTPVVVDKLALDKFPFGWHMQLFCCTAIELLLRILVFVRFFDLCYMGHCDSAANWI